MSYRDQILVGFSHVEYADMTAFAAGYKWWKVIQAFYGGTVVKSLFIKAFNLVHIDLSFYPPIVNVESVIFGYKDLVSVQMKGGNN